MKSVRRCGIVEQDIRIRLASEFLDCEDGV